MSVDNAKSAFRIHLDDCWCFCGRLADGGCDYLGLLLNLRGAHYRSRWAMQRCPRTLEELRDLARRGKDVFEL